MLGKLRPFFSLTALTLVFAAGNPARAEEAAKSAPTPAAASSGSLISANGFSCSTMDGQSQCQGKFEEVDKDVLIGARASGDIVVRAKKGDHLYTYSAKTGCLCDEEKDEIECHNAQGKKEKFKGEKMQDQRSAFCTVKK